MRDVRKVIRNSDRAVIMASYVCTLVYIIWEAEISFDELSKNKTIEFYWKLCKTQKVLHSYDYQKTSDHICFQLYMQHFCESKYKLISIKNFALFMQNLNKPTL